MTLLEDFESRLLLGVPAMDRSHRELVELIDRMDGASNATLAYLFPELQSHTKAHFAAEEVMMRDTDFPGLSDHRNEHTRLLGELDRLSLRLADGRVALARAFVHEQLPAWFTLHLVTMDSALAAHIRGRSARVRVET